MIILLYLVIFLIISAIFLILYLLKRDSKIVPIDDIGLLFSVFIALYTILPVSSWLLQGGQYILPVGRLYEMQPILLEVIELSLTGLFYIFGVLLIYYYSRKRLMLLSRSASLISSSLWVSNKLMSITLLMYVLGSSVYMFFKYKYGVYEAQSQSYDAGYVLYLNMPLIVAQMLNTLKGFVTITYTVFVLGLFMRWNNRKSRFLIGVIFLITVLNYDFGHARTELFQTIVLFALLYHLFVTPFESVKNIIAILVLLLIGFLLLGIRGDGVSAQFVLPLGEFDVIWGNAVEMLREKNQNVLNVPLYVYLYDFIAFIPSDILPFPKQSPQIWLMDTHYPIAKEEGNGLMFGAITQSVIGFGMLEAFIRGAIIGFISITFKSWLRSGKYSWWILTIFVMVYLSVPTSMIRGSTLAPIFSLLGTPLIVISLLYLLDKLLPSKKNNH
jgi:hypothetical protein